MAEAGHNRLLQLPRRADQQRGAQCLSLPSNGSLAPDAPAAKPEGPDDVGADGEAGGGLATEPPHPSSLAEPAVCRQTPEVGAVCGNPACTDLCGGRSVMGVPTANPEPTPTGRRSAVGRTARGQLRHNPRRARLRRRSQPTLRVSRPCHAQQSLPHTKAGIAGFSPRYRYIWQYRHMAIRPTYHSFLGRSEGTRKGPLIPCRSAHSSIASINRSCTFTFGPRARA
jgi:hypothetical protein